MIVIQYVFDDFDIGEKIEKLWILRKKLNNSNDYLSMSKSLFKGH